MSNFSKNENFFFKILLISILIFGIYLCLIGGYGSDEDTLPMIYVFEMKLSNGEFATSRFTGNPVAEIGIGFLSYFFGSFLANLVTYIFLLLGIVFFYFGISKNFDLNELILFLLICLTNPILFFDNLEPIDYSWALFFFCLGIFCLERKIFELAVVFFGICIGTRINFILFVLVVIFFFEHRDNLNLKRKFYIFFSSFIVGGLFYVPIWFENSFSLSWLTAARPLDQGLMGLIARFVYKTYISIGYLSFFAIIFVFLTRIQLIKKIKKEKNFNMLVLLCLANLLIFLWIPAEFSYLQVFLIVTSYLILKTKIKNFIYTFCALNLFSWLIFVSFVKVNYKVNEYCSPKNAQSVTFEISVKDGYLFKYLDDRKKIKCWVKGTSNREIKILQGKALK